MVYSLQWSPCTSFGGQLAAALGDGTVGVYSVCASADSRKGGSSSRQRRQTLNLDARLRGGHTLAATTLDWCPEGWGGMGGSGSGEGSKRDDGNNADDDDDDDDGSGGEKDVTPSRASPKAAAAADTTDERSRYLVSGGNDGNVVLWDVLDRRVLDGIKHGEGPNAVKCSGGGEGRVYVADTTNCIRLYQYR